MNMAALPHYQDLADAPAEMVVRSFLPYSVVESVVPHSYSSPWFRFVLRIESSSDHLHYRSNSCVSVEHFQTSLHLVKQAAVLAVDKVSVAIAVETTMPATGY